MVISISNDICYQHYQRVASSLVHKSPSELGADTFGMKMIRYIFGFFCFSLGVSNTISLPSEDSEGYKKAGAAVVKTVVSSKLRLLFWAGVEGTGHHYMQSVLDYFGATNNIISHDVINVKYYRTTRLWETTSSYNIYLEEARKDMQRLAALAEDINSPPSIATLDITPSYPFGKGGTKPLKYVDLRMLAELAEGEGVDLRIIYLKRSAHDLLVANTIHRQFQR